MNKLALVFIPVGYAITYWSLNILFQAYKRSATMNPPTLAMVLGIPGATTSAAAAATGTSSGSSPVAPISQGDYQYANQDAVDPSALNPDGTFKRMGQP